MCLFPWASYQIRKIVDCACAGNSGNVFPRRRLQRKPLVSDPGMYHGTCVTHVPWCMSELLTRGGGENVPGIPGACATRNFAYLARGPFSAISRMIRSGKYRWMVCNASCLFRIGLIDYLCITKCGACCLLSGKQKSDTSVGDHDIWNIILPAGNTKLNSHPGQKWPTIWQTTFSNAFSSKKII